MNRNQFESLSVGDKVKHKHYGICTVTEYIPTYGPILSPDTESGKRILTYHYRSMDTGLILETSKRLINII